MGNSCSSTKSSAVLNGTNNDDGGGGRGVAGENMPMKRKSLEKFLNEPAPTTSSTSSSVVRDSAKKSDKIDQPATKLIVSNVKEPTPFFTGRGDLLQKLHDTIQKNELAVVSSPAKNLRPISSQSFNFRDNSVSDQGNSGPTTTPPKDGDTSPGIGKSEMARKYLKRYGDYYNNIIWLQAGGGDTLLRHSFLDMALRHFNLGVEDTDGALETVVGHMYEKMAGEMTLLIFDDVVNAQEIEKWLPPPSKNRFVLVTARRPESWTAEQGYQRHQTLLLDPWGDEEGAKFIIQYLHHLDPASVQSAEDQKSAKNLNKLLHGLPLPLTLAVGYIKQERNLNVAAVAADADSKKMAPDFSIQDYAQLFQDEEMAIYDPKSDENDDIFKNMVTTAFNLTLSKFGDMNMPQLFEILDRLSLLHGSHIPRRLVYAIFFEIDMPLLDVFLEILENYGIIQIHNNKMTDAISIHQIFQKMTLDRLKRAGKFEIILEKVAETMHIFLTKFPLTIDDEMIVPMVNCMLTISNHIDSTRMSKNETLLKVALSADLQKIGNYAESIRLCQEVYNFVKNSVGDSDPLAIAAKKQIANAYVVKGDLDNGEKYFKQILNTQLQSLGEFHEECVKSMDNVAQVLETAGKFEESIKCFERIVDVKKIILGWDAHPDIIVVRKDVARLREKIKLAAVVVLKKNGGGSSGAATTSAAAGGFYSGGDDDDVEEDDAV